LAPWWLPALTHGAGTALLLDAGRLPGSASSGIELLTGRLDGLGAPWWLGVVVPVLAVLALVPRVSRIPVLICWMVAAVTALLALVLSFLDLGLVAGSSPAGQGALLVVLQGALVVACALAAPALAEVRVSASRLRRRALVGTIAVVAATVPVVGLGWFLVAGQPDLDEAGDADIPAYMVQSALVDPEHGILIIRGDVSTGLRYAVRRDDGVRLGEDEIVAHSAGDATLDDVVDTLVSRPTPAAVTALGEAGIEYVVLPSPADAAVSAELDATAGLVAASAEDRQTRAWQVDRPLSADQITGSRSWVRILLLVLQFGALAALAVLCGPHAAQRRRQ
uniref:hypothetical protein n=1 Tax=Nocardioides sp. TaxID=35761 RepID=UPI00356B1BAD